LTCVRLSIFDGVGGGEKQDKDPGFDVATRTLTLE
jgi:hypothetical protein